MNLTINTSVNKLQAKSAKPLKKVDLGAAANFGRVGTQSPLPNNNDDLLNDDFNPRAQEVPATGEFGDFENAFVSNSVQKVEDDFADFSTAFSQNSNQNLFSNNAFQSVTETVKPPIDQTLLSSISPISITSSQPNVFASSTLTNPTQNSNDLLGDLSGFSSLSIQPQNGNLFVSNDSVGLQNKNLLDGITGGKF